MVRFAVWLTVDTNVMVRAVVQDDVRQGQIAARILKNAERITVPLVVLCEFVGVLRRVYNFSKTDIASAITALIATKNVDMNRPAVEIGLAVLLAGGDFADGIIAFEGRWLGAETFVSFDKEAVAVLLRQGQSAQLL
jgi:predicted nucleic-acid-binding protein